MPARRVGGHAADHLVLEEALRQERPLALPVHRVAERGQLFPHRPRGLSLEHALVLEEGQVEVERGRVAGGRPVHRRGAQARGVGEIVDGRRAQQRGRVVDGIAGEVLGSPACRD